MNFAQETATGPRRFVGIGLVLAIHLIIIWALASGLARKVVEAVKGPIELAVVEEKVKPPPPPEVQVTAAPPPAAIQAPVSNTPPAQREVAAPAPAPAAPPAAVARPAGPFKAAMVCTKMGQPAVPGLSWSGEALFKVLATVKAGRVSAIEVLSSRMQGGNDRRVQRAMLVAIEAALRDSYECPGDHVFEQDFLFRID